MADKCHPNNRRQKEESNRLSKRHEQMMPERPAESESNRFGQFNFNLNIERKKHEKDSS